MGLTRLMALGLVPPDRCDVFEAWCRKRSEFSHDWLNNRFLNRLQAFLLRLEDGAGDTESLERFVRVDFAEWSPMGAEARRLLDEFEHAMSPRAMLSTEPLCNLDPKTKEWLASVVDRLWRTRYPVTRWIETAIERLESASRQSRLLSAELSRVDPREAGALNRLLGPFQEFERRCRALKAAISELPDRVLVV